MERIALGKYVWVILAFFAVIVLQENLSVVNQSYVWNGEHFDIERKGDINGQCFSARTTVDNSEVFEVEARAAMGRCGSKHNAYAIIEHDVQLEESVFYDMEITGVGDGSTHATMGLVQGLESREVWRAQETKFKDSGFLLEKRDDFLYVNGKNPVKYKGGNVKLRITIDASVDDNGEEAKTTVRIHEIERTGKQGIVTKAVNTADNVVAKRENFFLIDVLRRIYETILGYFS